MSAVLETWENMKAHLFGRKRQTPAEKTLQHAREMISAFREIEKDMYETHNKDGRRRAAGILSLCDQLVYALSGPRPPGMIAFYRDMGEYSLRHNFSSLDRQLTRFGGGNEFRDRFHKEYNAALDLASTLSVPRPKRMLIRAVLGL